MASFITFHLQIKTNKGKISLSGNESVIHAVKYIFGWTLYERTFKKNVTPFFFELLKAMRTQAKKC